MNSQEKIKDEINWSSLIKDKRTDLGESQTVFGQRFGVSHVSVSKWENGLAEAPYAVTWWLVGLKDFDCTIEATDEG